MAPSLVLMLVVTGGVISATGLLASWVIRFENFTFFLNSSTIISDAPQTDGPILSGILTVAEGLSKAHTHTNLPQPTPMKMMSRVTSRSSVQPRTSSSVVEPSTGSQETTAGGRSTSSETVEKVETLTTLTAQKTTLKPENITNIIPTHQSEADATIFIQTTEVGSTKKDSQTTNAETVVTCFTQTVTTGDDTSASPIPEPITHETKSGTNRVTSKSIETSKAGLQEDTFRTTITTTETKTGAAADITSEKMAPGTEVKPTEPQFETSETTTVTPEEPTQATKLSERLTTMNTKHTTIAPTTATAENSDKKQLTITAADTSITKTNVLVTAIKRFTSRSSLHIPSTGVNGLSTVSPVRPSGKVFHKLTSQSHKRLSPCKGKCITKSTEKNPAGRQDNNKVPSNYDKTLYSAITMGCILALCTILAFIVFIKDCSW